MTSTVGSDPCDLYPRSYSDTTFQDLCAAAFAAMAELMPGHDLPRVPGWDGATAYAELLDRYGHLPRSGAADPRALVREMSTDLMSGTTVWRSADLQYNIGSAVNVVAAAMYALGLDLNVFLTRNAENRRRASTRLRDRFRASLQVEALPGFVPVQRLIAARPAITCFLNGSCLRYAVLASSRPQTIPLRISA